MESSEWLAGLKAGDEVAVGDPYYTEHMRLATVEKRTKTQIVVAGETYRYNARTSSKIGGSDWSRDRITRPTQEIRDAIERRNLQNAIESTHMDRVALDTLRQVWALLKPPAPKGETHG